MKLILQRLVQEPDKSFIVYHEKEPFFSSPWHYHPEYELLLILKSTGKCIIGDYIGQFEEGDLFFMGSQLPHVFDNDDLYTSENMNEAQAIVVQFLPDFFGKEFTKAPEFQLISEILGKSGRGMKIEGASRHLIADKMKSMLAIDGFQRVIDLLSIFDILSKTTEFEYLSTHGFLHNNANNSSERFHKINDYIMKNFTKDIPLSTIAEIANMTPTNFCTFFKNFYRQTFVEYLNNIRVGYACKLLANYEKNISEVAYESGFNNISNFNRQSKKHKEVSPVKYRHSLSKKSQQESR